MNRPAKLRQIAAFAAIALPAAVTFPAHRDDTVAHAEPIAAKPAISQDDGFRLPWAAGHTQYLTQDANDDCCSDHVGANKNAYDFASWDGTPFDVLAPAAGTVVHVKMSSKHGCGDSSCVNDANYVVIDHGDGTQTTLLHLAYGSLDPSIKCGTFVRRGQRIAVTGTTGWSTGVHLHVERDQVKKNLKEICECGADGMGCSQSAAKWTLFWPTPSQPNLATKYTDWSSSDAPKNRRGLIGPSTNVDHHEEVATLGVERVTWASATGTWTEQNTGAGAFRYADADGKSSASLSLKGQKPGLYEVWARVPVAASVATGETSVTLKSDKGTFVGTLDAQTVGGGFHRIKGLEQVVLAGGDDALVFSSTQATPGKVVVASEVLLRRIAPLEAEPQKVASKAL